MGSCVATKRFWIRNVVEDGTKEEYLNRINDDIKKGWERIRGPQEGGCGENAQGSIRETVTISERIIGENLTENVEGTEKENDKVNESYVLGVGKDKANEGLHQILSGEANIHSLLKESMAGSMREVIKDELQAWLGLKGNQIEEEDGIQEMANKERNAIEISEEGELEGSNNEEEGIRSDGEANREREGMISPIKKIFEEEYKASNTKDRRTSTRQAEKRMSKDYEMDTVARAAKRKECMEEKGNLAQESRTTTPDRAQRPPEAEGSRHVRPRL